MPNIYKNIPLATDILSISQADLLANFNYLVNTLGTGTASATNGDHQISINGDDSTTGEGMHRQISLIDRASNPALPAGANSLIWGNGSSVFWRNAGASAIILNASVGTPSTSTTNGYTFLPGPIGSGLMLQWGIKTVSLQGTSTAITFSPAFIAAPLTVQVTCINTQGDSPSANNVYVKSGTVAAGGFTVTNSSSGGVTQIYWLAIGIK